MMTITKPAAVLFDLDGTLIDTAPDFVVALNKLRTEEKLEALPASLIRSHVSDGARALVKLGFGGNEGEVTFEKLRTRLLDLYKQYAGNECTLFDGFNTVLEMLESKDIPWGIVTNKPRLYTDIILEKMSLNKRCSISICPDDVSNSKPDPEGLHKATASINVATKDCFYVGDHERDIEAGRRAGMKTIAVKFGYLKHVDEASTWQADLVIDQPLQLLQYV